MIKKMAKKTKKKIIKKTLKKKVIVKKIRTEKQKKLIKLISENLGKNTGAKTMLDMMIEAGYARSTALQQTSILCEVKETKEFKNYIERLESHREEIMKRMEALVGTAKYGELSMTLARIENIILLGQGKPTSIVNELSEKEKKAMDDLYKENS